MITVGREVCGECGGRTRRAQLVTERSGGQVCSEKFMCPACAADLLREYGAAANREGGSLKVDDRLVREWP